MFEFNRLKFCSRINLTEELDPIITPIIGINTIIINTIKTGNVNGNNFKPTLDIIIANISTNAVIKIGTCLSKKNLINDLGNLLPNGMIELYSILSWSSLFSF